MRWLFLILYIFSYLYTGFLLYLNAQQRMLELPDNIQDVYDEEQYQIWQRYEGETDRFVMITKGIELLLTGILILSPYFGWLSSLLPEHVLINSLLMMIITWMIEQMIQIPLKYYRTFVIEEKYQMNTMTLKIFVVDLLKESLVDMGILGVLFVFVHFFLLWFDYIGFVVLFMVLAIVLIFIQSHALLIMKIFNTFTPLAQGELKTQLTQMVEKHGFQLKGIYVMDASKRTKRANAFCSGVGKTKEISLDDNMLNQYDEDEILAVFAHEFAHAALNHTEKLKWMNYMQLILIFMIFMFVMMNQWLYADFGIHQQHYFMAMLVLSWVIEPFMKGFMVIFNHYSRQCEYAADAFAAKEGYGEELIRLLKKLSRDDLSHIYPHPFVVKLSYSHPPLSQRVAAIEKYIREN